MSSLCDTGLVTVNDGVSMALYQPVVGHFSNLTVAAGLKRQRNSGGLFEFASTVPVYCEHLEVCVCVYLDEAAEQAASRQGS